MSFQQPNTIIFSFGTKYEPLDPKTLKKIKIDYNSFKTLYESHSKISFNYYKDIRNVYFNNFIIEKANPKTFKVLGLSFSKDDKFVFYNTEVLKGIDSKSFRKSKNGYTWKDDFGNEFDFKGNRISEKKL